MPFWVIAVVIAMEYSLDSGSDIKERGFNGVACKQQLLSGKTKLFINGVSLGRCNCRSATDHVSEQIMNGKALINGRYRHAIIRIGGHGVFEKGIR
jgi:hypothetical protein